MEILLHTAHSSLCFVVKFFSGMPPPLRDSVASRALQRGTDLVESIIKAHTYVCMKRGKEKKSFLRSSLHLIKPLIR